MDKECFIFDIDGTIANLDHRLPFIKKQPKEWDLFFEGVIYDKPIPHVIRIIKRIVAFDTPKLVYVSGRPERTYKDTFNWMVHHDIPTGDAIYMRKDGDRRDDVDVKCDILKELIDDGYKPVMVFDDRSRVVTMWRACGVPCAQVAPGDF